jgi:Asp-tRNA(Asn)/Glu-tRNA(Gln) amidotransferase B subunit
MANPKKTSKAAAALEEAAIASAQAESAGSTTLVELQKLISSRQSELKKLQKKREKLMALVKEVDADIVKITGGGIIGRGRRGNNDKPLRVYVEEQLSKNKKGLTLAELAQSILDTGFKTSSANFRNVLYQSLYNSTSIKHDPQTGKYIITK